MPSLDTYLQYIPINENAIILGANWLRVEWKPSRQLVCASGEACLIPLTKDVLLRAEQSFSYTGESDNKVKYYLLILGMYM